MLVGCDHPFFEGLVGDFFSIKTVAVIGYFDINLTGFMIGFEVYLAGSRFAGGNPGFGFLLVMWRSMVVDVFRLL